MGLFDDVVQGFLGDAVEGFLRQKREWGFVAQVQLYAQAVARLDDFRVFFEHVHQAVVFESRWSRVRAVRVPGAMR